jgi:hypothetical protein
MAADQDAGFEPLRERARRDEFLDTMNTTMPCAELRAAIKPHYWKRGSSRPLIGPQRILPIHFARHRFALGDFACEEALRDSGSLRRFVEIGLGGEAAPDLIILHNFGGLPETPKLGEQLFRGVAWVLQASGVKRKSSHAVDPEILGLPGTTKNLQMTLDSEMHQISKGKHWHFGTKPRSGRDGQALWCARRRSRRLACVTGARRRDCYIRGSGACTVTSPIATSRRAGLRLIMFLRSSSVCGASRRCSIAGWASMRTGSSGAGQRLPVAPRLDEGSPSTVGQTRGSRLHTGPDRVEKSGSACGITTG